VRVIASVVAVGVPAATGQVCACPAPAESVLVMASAHVPANVAMVTATAIRRRVRTVGLGRVWVERGVFVM
jgi:hypothetical protein